MAKYLVRILLSLSILISSGYSAVYANLANESTIDSYGGTFENSIGVNSTRQHPLTFSTSKDHGNDIFVVNNSKVEEEEEEFLSSNFLPINYLFAVDFAGIFGFLFLDLSEDLHFSKFIPDTYALRLHVVFQVFTI